MQEEKIDSRSGDIERGHSMSEATPAQPSVEDRPEGTDAKQGSSPRYVRAERRQPMPGEQDTTDTCLNEPMK